MEMEMEMGREGRGEEEGYIGFVEAMAVAGDGSALVCGVLGGRLCVDEALWGRTAYALALSRMVVPRMRVFVWLC